jgi:hypothetical protein
VGQAFNFNGINQYVRDGTNASMAPANITVSYWVFARAIRPDHTGVISRWGNSTSTPNSWIFDLQPNQQMYFSLRNASGQQVTLGSVATVPLNQWRHIVGTYDGAAVKLYVDGQLTSQTPFTGPLNATTSTTSFGAKFADGTFSFPFNGMVDEPVVLNRAISDTEVGELYAANNDGRAICRAMSNTTPTLTNVPQSPTIDELAPYMFDADASDPDSDQSLMFSLINGPDGAAIDPSSGVFVWAPGEAQGPGSYPFMVRVSDGVANRDAPITITVNEVNASPELAALGNHTVAEGSALTVTASAADTDLPANVLTFTLDPGFPAGATITGAGGFSWTPSEEQGPGDYPVTVHVADDGTPPLSDTETFTIHVAEVSQAPTLAAIPDPTVAEGSAVIFTASGVDGDLPANTLTYSLDAGAPAGAAIDPSTGVFTWTPAEADGPADHPVTVRVKDNGTPEMSGTRLVTIHVTEENQAPTLLAIGDLTVSEGVPLGFTASASDTDEPINVLTYEIASGAQPGMAIDPGTGAFSWTPTETQGSADYTVTLRVKDDGTPQLGATTEVRIYVNEVNQAPTLGAIPDQTIDEGQPITFTATAGDLDEPANGLALTAIHSISGTQPTTSTSPGQLAFSWTPSEEQGPGDYDVTILAEDNGQPPLSTQTTVHIHVNEANQAPSLTIPESITTNEGQTATFTAAAVDTDLPANTLTFALLTPPTPAGATIVAATGAVSWLGVDDGVFTFRVSASDGVGGVTTGDVSVIVRNVTPTVTVTGPASGAIYPVGTAVAFTGTFTDPGTADTHAAIWSFDATSQTGTVDQAAKTVTTSKSFSTPGVYLVQLTVTDDDGGTGTATEIGGFSAMVVVYDPNAGFVTGGGWITSPPGAYTPDPILTGKSNFGFVSRYKKGATIPTGETEFQFNLASINFHSAAYDWLVIAGAKGQYKGTGTINNAGNYKFLLTATDGQISGGGGVDKFRMKIWDPGTSQVIYDSQLGASDTTSASLALGGGSIVIHQTSGNKSATDPVALAAEGLPLRFALHHNYPNPFRATTRFRFDLAEGSAVSAGVYDVQGRKVRSLTEDTFPQGRYEQAWDGRDAHGRPVAKGVYFYKLTVRGLSDGARFDATRKVIVVR